MTHVNFFCVGIQQEFVCDYFGCCVFLLDRHSGIVVFGKEYFWGGILQVSRPGNSPYGQPSKVIDIGTTSVSEDVFNDFLNMMSPNYNVDTYNLIHNNCNNFSNECSMFLTGNEIPYEVLKLPEEILSTPFGQMILPMIQSLEQNAKTQMNNNGGHWSLATGSTEPILPTNEVTSIYQKQKGPVQFSDRVLYKVDDGNVVPVLNKIINSLDEETAKELMKSIRDKSQKKGEGISTEEISQFLDLTKNAPEGEVWRYLYVIHFLVLQDSICDLLFTTYLSDMSTIIENNLNGGYIVSVMANLIYLNLFSNESGKGIALSSSLATSVLDSLISGFTSATEKLKECYVKIIYNFSISLDNTSNELTTMLAFFLIEHLSSVTEDDYTTLLLKSLGHLLQDNTELISLSKDIGYDDVIASYTFANNTATKIKQDLQTIFQ
eukprot:TRINITY_DN3381_c0_g1_i1.p1 TRINITY_DN3381_c0_g1~~TRINITY_DN3381_c0_g1_i1.p1  ORF type:complete len:435 (-),score=71.48 TRINITY_DN3381_c0_g1_i1:735-2039(-)